MAGISIGTRRSSATAGELSGHPTIYDCTNNDSGYTTAISTGQSL